MVAGGLPTVQVFLDDGTGTFPYELKDAAGVSYARLTEGLTVTRGRQDELANVTAGQCTLVLDNADGRFSYGSTLIATPSPVLVDQQVRVKVTANGTTVNRYTGTLSAAPVSFPSGGDEFALVSVTLVDAQAQAERRKLLSVIEEEYLQDSPVAYYVLNEPAVATSYIDSSGNQALPLSQHGSGSPVTFGTATGPSTDGYTAAQFNGGNYLLPAAAITGTFFQGHEATFLRSGALAVEEGLIPNLSGSPATFGLWLAYMNTSGHIVCGSLTSPLAYNDGKTHHLYLDSPSGSLYVDGVAVATGGTFSVTFSQSALTGVMSHMAFYSNPVSAGRIAAHAAAVLNGFAGESGTARLTRIAGYAGIPVGTLDTSLTNMAFEDITGKTAQTAMQDVADAEFGLTFMDGSGNLAFHNRNRAVAKTAPDITIDANFLDPGTQFYYDTQGILNYVDVTAVGTSVTQIARNLVSEFGVPGSPKHGRYTDSKTYLVQTDAESLDRGNWLVSTHAQPIPRVGSLVVDLLTMTAAQQAAWLASEANTWVRVTGLPAQSGNPGGTTADLIVEGFAEALNASASGAVWALTVNAVQRKPFFQAWILGDTTYGVLDSTTKLYV
jgi:hypothetical protein